MAMLLAVAFAVLVPQEPPLRATILSGANNHDWQWTTPEIARVLSESGRFQVETTDQPATWLADAPEKFARGELHVLVLDYNSNQRWGEAAEQGFLTAVANGVGVVALHAANNAFAGWSEYERMIGLMWRQGTGHGAFHPFDVAVVDRNHAITDGMADLRAHPDELYHRLVYTPGAEFKVLLSAYSDPKTGGTGRHEPMATVAHWGKGRVFHTPLGHVWTGVPQSRASWADAQLRQLVARGTEWAATGKVTLSPTPLNCLTEQEAKEGFVLLFDGRQPSAWRGYKLAEMPDQGWTIRDASLVHEAGSVGGDLVTRDEYEEFEFRFSFRVAKKANSGVMWHVTEDNATAYMSGPEFQVLDDEGAAPSPKHGVGALYDLVPPTGHKPLPAGCWNEARIVVRKDRIRFWLNGNRVVDAPGSGPEWEAMIAASKFKDWPFGKAARGRLCLQDHGDEVAYRNLRVKSL